MWRMGSFSPHGFLDYQRPPLRIVREPCSAGEKDTPLGAGEGGFSFEMDLNRNIVVRRDHAGHASGAPHDDPMVKPAWAAVSPVLSAE